MSSTSTLTIPGKLDLLENNLNGMVFERQKEIKTAVTALVAKKHHLQFGEPGIAKTYLVDLLVKLVDGLGPDTYFRWLMTRFTTPAEIVGPPSLKGLENDIYRVNTAHKLPEARIVFLDEIFKANSAILNSLLTLINEGLFFNNGTPIEVPLMTMFCGSNEIPRESELAALFDRITFRHHVERIKESSNRQKMLRARLARANSAVILEPIISVDEIILAQETAAKVQIADEVFDAIESLVSKLHRAGIEPSDRRVAECIPIIQATAFRAGRSIADVDDMRLLRHVLWNDFKDQPVVDKLVLELANPIDKEAMDLLELVEKLAVEVQEIVRDVDASNIQQRRRQGIEINGKLERAGDDLDKLTAKSAKAPRRSEMIGEVKTRLSTVVRTLLHDLYGVDEIANR